MSFFTSKISRIAHIVTTLTTYTATMTGHANPFIGNATIIRFCIALASLFAGVFNPLFAQPEDSECMFEFNKAYAIHDSGKQQLEAAQKYVEQNHFQNAKERYRLAADLFQQSIDYYNGLTTLAPDCSATNVSIAKNNSQLAFENLQWAKNSLNGLDCLKSINDLESLSNLASEYYYKYKDPNSAKRTAADALNLSAQIRKDGQCEGEYKALLEEQHRFTKSIADALENRGKFDNCVTYIKSAEAAEQQARSADQSKNKSLSQIKWQETLRRANDGITTNACDGLYLKQLQNLQAFAKRRLNEQL